MNTFLGWSDAADSGFPAINLRDLRVSVGSPSCGTEVETHTQRTPVNLLSLSPCCGSLIGQFVLISPSTSQFSSNSFGW